MGDPGGLCACAGCRALCTRSPLRTHCFGFRVKGFPRARTGSLWVCRGILGLEGDYKTPVLGLGSRLLPAVEGGVDCILELAGILSYLNKVDTTAFGGCIGLSFFTSYS